MKLKPTKGNRSMTMNTGKVTSDSPIEFGRVYRDSITGFEGKCIGLTRWITGCDQIALQPPTTKDEHGKQDKADAKWFDDGRLVLVEEGRQMASSGKGAAGVTASLADIKCRGM